MKALKMVCSDWVKGQGHKTQSHLKGEKWIPLSNFLVFRQVLNCWQIDVQTDRWT